MVESRLHLVKMRVLPSTHAFVFGAQQRSFIGFPGLGTASFVAASMSPVSTTSMGVLNVRAGFSFAASAPHRGLAREEVVVLVDGIEQRLEIVRQERIHGQQAYWACPRCSELRWHLYARGNEIACRRCLRLSY